MLHRFISAIRSLFSPSSDEKIDEFWSEDGKNYYHFDDGIVIIAKNIATACELASRSAEQVVKILPMFDDIEYNLDDFEATDSQGYSMEGIAVFCNKNYPVYVSMWDDKSYPEQIREQVHEQFNLNMI